MIIEPIWLQRARADIGQRETNGKNDSPWIRKMLAALKADWLLGQPWCGGAVAKWMQACGIEPAKNWWRAKAWLDWREGCATDDPPVGCVVVFERQGGGHVGLVVGRDQRGRLLVLGGNQGDSVSIAPFDPSRVVGYRWPGAVVSPSKFRPLPVYASAADSSTNEA
jgi:uncharacterized protein (TIGR02594 family)